MKILVISDTHGSLAGLQMVLKQETDIQMIIHCGDVEGQSGKIYAMTGVPCYFVAGNNDWSPDLPKELIVNIDRYTFFICHGHRYGVSYNRSGIHEEAARRRADVCLYGHTHIPDLDFYNGIYFMNPGSLTYPRQRGRKMTYGVIEIDEVHEIHCRMGNI